MKNRFTILHPADDVAIALDTIEAGAEPVAGVTTSTEIAPGHKFALRSIERGGFVRRYNQIIGMASREIRSGDHVHVHNLEMADFERDYAFGVDARPTEYVDTPASFRGIIRANGQVATRNYIGIISSVNCSATVCRAIADHFRNRLDDYPNVDGVIALTHKGGCGLDAPIEGIQTLKRCIAGFVRHPNFAHVLLVGLGCEISNLGDLLQGAPGDLLSIQEIGGTSATVRAGIARIEAALPEANRARRQEVPLSELKLALQCGGSDGHSGISCNPALGAAVDRLVRHGGTAILSETTEAYGAEHTLTRRAVSREVGEKLVNRIRWWEDFTARRGMTINNNPSPGNKKGGLTTIIEKALGSVTKSGNTNLVEVYQYAEPVTAKGLVFMDAPSLDPVGATAQVAGGANMMVFTTGRGSAFGCKPTPSIKLSDNTPLFEKMHEDMDINCGTILDGTESVDDCGERIFQKIIAVASGEYTKSELLGYGEEEFSPWDMGVLL